MLFLTTNRVGSFDDAFISRVHLKLYYPNFTPEQRKQVWQTFVDKLNQERGDYIRLHGSADEYLESKEMQALAWNGREIRNGENLLRYCFFFPIADSRSIHFSIPNSCDLGRIRR